VHPADFFEDDVGAAIEIHGGARSVSVLNVELLDRLCAGPLPDETDLPAAEGLFDLVEHELIAYGTPTGQGAVFLTGTPHGQAIQGTYYPPAPAYQVTLTDSSSGTADVTGLAVTFYDISGSETGSDQQTVKETFITSGQSLT
jgi:hypothetical protein